MNKKTTTPKTDVADEATPEIVPDAKPKPKKRDPRLVSGLGVNGPRKQLEAIIESAKADEK